MFLKIEPVIYLALLFKYSKSLCRSSALSPLPYFVT